MFFSTQPLLGVEGTVTCFLNASGDQDQETNGLFETLHNRMDIAWTQRSRVGGLK